MKAPPAPTPLRPRRHTWFFRASNTVSYGRVAGGLERELMAPISVALPLSLIAVLISWALDQLFIGLTLTLVFLVAAVLFNQRKAMRLHAGMKGEKSALKQLLRVPDAAIFNDVLIGRENADQIVVTEQGVFTIEVKNWAEVVVNHHGITSRGKPALKIVPQAKRQAGKVAALIYHKVSPVVVFTSPHARVYVRELEGVTVCTLSQLAPTLTRLRQQATYPLTTRKVDQTIDKLEELTEP